MPKLVNAHNKLMGEPEFLEEKILWGTSNFLDEAGVPLNTRNFQPRVVEFFKTVGDVILNGEVNKANLAELMRGLGSPNDSVQQATAGS